MVTWSAGTKHGMIRPFSSISGRWKHPTFRPIPQGGTIVRILASGELVPARFSSSHRKLNSACNRPVRHLPTGRNPPRRWNWKPTCGNTAKPLANTSTTSDHERRLQRTGRTICMGVQRRMPDLPDHGRYLCHRTRPTALLLRL